MPDAIFQFPAGFLWGAATAAHQVEGNNTNNCWWEWEKQAGHILQEHKSGLACDWWGGRWKEDFDRAAAAGQNAHRLSVEWSRIQPAPDRWDETALEMYRQIIRGLHDRNMTPMVTLHHFSDPLWLAELGGWENEETPMRFQKFVRKVVEGLKDYVSLWCPINEPNVFMYSGYFEGTFPPGKKDMDAGFTVLANLVRGHAAAYHVIHEVQPQAKVGIAMHYRSFRPARNWFPLDKWVANTQTKLFNDAFPHAIATGKLDFVYTRENIPEALKTMDFFGVQYYTRDLVQFALTFKGVFSKRFFPKDAEQSKSGFIANVPEGMFEALRWANSYGLPIIVTENGIDDTDDTLRPQYMIEHIHQMWRAVNFNIPVRGYFHWTLVDNFEWERGWTQRFGLWGLNENTQERIHRKSVDIYKTICNENGVSSQMVRQYVPQIFEKLFPG